MTEEDLNNLSANGNPGKEKLNIICHVKYDPPTPEDAPGSPESHTGEYIALTNISNAPASLSGYSILNAENEFTTGIRFQ